MKKWFRKLTALLMSALVITSGLSFSAQPCAADADTSLYGEVLVSDAGSNPTIQNSNTSRNLAVSPDGTIYAAYRCGDGIRVTKSTDNGRTFQSSVVAYPGQYEVEIATSSSGAVYLAWVEGGNAKLSKSMDGGVTFSTPVVIGDMSLSNSVHIAVDGNHVYAIGMDGRYLYVSSDSGSTFTSYILSTDYYVFSDVHVDPITHYVIVQEDNPNIKYYISQDYGATFSNAVVPTVSDGSTAYVFYSVGSIGSDSTGHYLLIGGVDSTGVKINLDNESVSSPDMGNNLVAQGRSLSDDAYGNLATGYSDGTYVYFKVSHDLGSTFGSPIQVATSTVANASINTTNGNVLFLYEKNGNIYLRVYGNLLNGYSINVSNSSLYFDADSGQTSKDVTITNTSTQAVAINSITISGDYSIDRSAVGSSLASGQSAVIHVTFQCSNFGTSTGSLDINYGDPAQDKMINLNGHMSILPAATPSVGTQPQAASVTAGSTANFSVAATVSDGGALSYQWQCLPSGGSTWSNVTGGSGATSASYTTGTLAVSDSGSQYRCVVTNTNNGLTASATSNAAALTVGKQTPSLSTPTAAPSASQTYPGNVTFSATLSGYCGTLGNQTITFYNNGVSIGTASTNDSGVASLTLSSPSSAAYSITAGFAGDPNNNAVSSGAFSYSVNKGTQTALSIDDPGSKTYGDASFKLTVSGGSGSGTLSYISGNTNVLTVDGSGNVTIVGAGTATITVTNPGDSNYNSTSKDIPITVSKKTLNAVITPKDKTYDGSASAEVSSITCSGIVGSDDVSIAGGALAFSDKNAGSNKAVTASGYALTGTKAANYILGTVTAGTASIAKKTLTVSVNPISIKRGQSIVGHMTVAVTGFVGGETTSSLTEFQAPTASTAYTDNMTPVSAQNITVTYAGGNATGNYQFDEINTTALLTVSSVSVGSSDYTVGGTSGSWSDNQNPAAWSTADLTVSPAGGYDQISADGSTWVSSLTVSNETKNGSVTFYLRNSSDGTVTDGKTVYYNLDKTAPTGMKIHFATNDFTEFLNTITFGLFFKDTLDVTLSADGAISDIDHYQYQLVSEGSTYSETGSWTDSTDGTFKIDPQFKGVIYARAVDKAGNVSYAVSSDGIAVDNQSPTAPTLAATVNGGSYSGAWTNGDVVITASAADALSGINHYEYSIGGGAWTVMPSGTLTITNDMNGDVHVRAVSGSGVNGDESTITVKRDTVVPVISGVTGNTAEWTNGNVTLTVNSSDAAGVTSYSFDGGKTWQASASSTYAANTTIAAGSVQVKDAAGNVTSYDTAIDIANIDKIAPTISGVTGNAADWTNGDVTLTVNATDTASNIAAYSFDGGKTWQTSASSTYAANTTVAAASVQVKDNAGNVTSYDTEINITKIDKTAPTISSVTGNAADWTNSDVTLTANAADTASNIAAYSFDGGKNWQTSASSTYAANTAIAAGSIQVKDNAGNVTSYDTAVTVDKIDKTAPTGMKIHFATNDFTSFLNTITFGLFFKDTLDVTLSADGAASGIDHYQYQLVTEGGTYSETGSWTDSADGTFSINPQFKGVIYARAVDKAGNVSYAVSSDGIAVDNQSPTAPTLAATVNGGSYSGGWTNGDVVITASGADALSGIARYEYKIGDSGEWTVMPSGTLTIANDMNGDIHVRAVSDSGINGSESIIPVKRDTVVPVLGVSVTGTTGRWTLDPVTFTLSNTAENSSPVTYMVKCGDGDWTAVEGSTYAFTGNVDTTVQFKAVSASGVESTFSDAVQVRLAGDTLKAVVDDIDKLPDPVTASDQQITDNGQAIKDTKILYDSLGNDEKSGVGEARTDKLNALVTRLNALLVIVPKDEATGVTAGNLGTSVQVPELNDPAVSKVVVSLKVDPLSTGTSQQANIAIASQTMDKSEKDILAAFDVSLFKSVYDAAGTEMSSGKVSNSNIVAPITIQIPIPSEYTGRTDLQIVYIDDNGNVTPLETTLVTVNGVKYLQFTTTHFSVYAITAKQKSIAPGTGEAPLFAQTALPVSLLVLSAFTLLFVRGRKKAKADR